MEWSTHALAGMAAGYMVTGGEWKGAIVGGVAGVISDLDEPKSKFGTLFFPISFPLNALFGHRTFTHSLSFILLISLILLMVKEEIVLAVAAGLIAHIVCDMLTGKVRVLYPLKISIGIPIAPFMFIVIDRVFRVTMICLLIAFAWKDLSHYFRLLGRTLI